MRKAILALAICVGLATSPAIPARQRGARVGFWASQTLQPCASSTDPAYCPRDLSSYTPEVWDALASAHGSLFLNLVYGSDFGPTPAGKTQRTDGLALVREANRRGITVNAWVTAPFDGGTFANENNASIMAAAIRAMRDWTISNALRIDEVVLDNDFPVGDQPFAELLAGDPSGLLRPNIDPAQQCEAIATYRDAITWAHRHGMRVTGAPVPFALDDLFDGSLALQDALDITAFPPLNYDTWYLQAYRSYDDVGAGYVSGYYRDMQRFFGARGQITIGDVNLGTPPYDDLANLVRDVRM